jgi:homoserine kinase
MTLRYNISVPASSANLGPGYDCLGLALDIRLQATAIPADEWTVDTRGEGSHLLDNCELNLIARAFRVACENNGWPVQPMQVESDNPIPIARGLGSSAAAIVTGMALAQLANGGDIDKDALFRGAIELEGHPDNVAAAVYGGLQEIARTTSSPLAHQLELAESVKVLLAIPTQMKSTAELREIVPDTIPSDLQRETDYALQQVLKGLASGNPTQLRYSEQDHRHQPYRLDKQPESQAIFEILQGIPQIAGVFLSGAGTTVAGWVVENIDLVGLVEQRLSDHSIPAAVQLVSPDNEGVKGIVIHE